VSEFWFSSRLKKRKKIQRTKLISFSGYLDKFQHHTFFEKMGTLLCLILNLQGLSQEEMFQFRVARKRILQGKGKDHRYKMKHLRRKDYVQFRRFNLNTNMGYGSFYIWVL